MRQRWAAATLAIFLACSDYGSEDEARPAPAPATPPTEAGVACDHVCGENESCRGGQCVLGCPDGILYVSSSGSDANRGCLPSAPKKTIGGAIAYVKTVGIVAHEIRVCRGVYAEPNLLLDYPVALRGGYECATWARREPFGFQGFDAATGRAIPFDATNETIIDAAAGPVALDVTGTAVTHDITIEGFTIRGRAGSGGTGLAVRGGAAPIVAHDIILGGASTGSLVTAASTGVDVADDAAPEITKCRIDGGSGEENGDTRYGSRGIMARTSGAARIHDNEIDAGHGTAVLGLASIGVEISAAMNLTGPDAFARNRIFFRGATKGLQPTSGLKVLSGSRVDVLDNYLIGEDLSCSNGEGCVVFTHTLSGPSRAIGNRVFAGNAIGSPQPVSFFGIMVDASGTDVDVINNVIDTSQETSGFGKAIWSQAGALRTRLIHNTLHAGKGTAMGVGAGTTIANNLVFDSTFGVLFETCAPLAAVDANAFVTTANLVTKGACAPGAGGTTITTAEAALDGKGHDNVAVLPACSPDDGARCTVCSSAGCLADVFDPAPTKAALLAKDWTLAPNVSCSIATGAADLGALVPTDIRKTPRTPKPSIGAVESDRAGCP